jgi:hypothetical protein
MASMKTVALATLLFASGAHAESEMFYFVNAKYTKCPSSGSPPIERTIALPILVVTSTWTIEGPVSGPWIKGTMHADGTLNPLGIHCASTSNCGQNASDYFEFMTKWQIKDDSGGILLAASCSGSSLYKAMGHEPQLQYAPWWEQCAITSRDGKYAAYFNHHILTSGFAPIVSPGSCVANESHISGYKIVVD